ncbi:MAG: extracellular solute-binding protein [Pseudomonadota bacterium]
MIKRQIGLVLAATALSGTMAISAWAQTEIEVWVGGEPGTTNVYDDLAAAYMAANPDVQINVTKVGSDLFNPVLVPSLSGGEGPDVFMYGTGPGQPAAIINGGLVADLTPYYRQYGWDAMIPESIENTTSSDGRLWAVGNEVENTAMFYNRAIFDELGLGVPETWADFEATVEALIEAGYDTPIGLGAADRWPISHWQSMLFGRFASPAGVEEVMFGDGAWTEAAFVDASALLQEMTEEGYFGPNPVANGYAEIMDSFWAGDIPMTFTGPWIVPGAVESLGDGIADFGTFQVPPMADDQAIHPTEDIGSGFYVNANSEHPDVSADILDFFFFNDDGRLMLLNNGSIPIGSLTELLPDSTLPAITADLRAQIDSHRPNGTIHAFLDTVTPASMTNVTYDGLQALMLGVMTPEQFVEAIQAEWEVAKAVGAILMPGGVADN